MPDLVGLPPRRFEEDRGAGAPVDVPQRPFGVGVERLAVRLLTGDVGVDRCDEARLAELAQYDAPESGLPERSRCNLDERLRASLAETLLRRDRDPLGQHRQRAARLLVLWQRLPLALEDRQRCRMERVTGLEAALQELARLGLGRRRVHRRPLGRELRPPLEAPVAEGLGDGLPDLLAPQVPEEPPPDDLADLGLVIGDQVLGDAPHDLRDPVLPPRVPVGHLDLAARQADHRRAVRRAGGRDGQVLDEGVERLGAPAVAVQEVEHLVEEEEHGRPGGLEDPRDRLGAGRRGLRRGPERLDALVARELAGDVDPRRLAARLRIPGVAHEDGDACLRTRGEPSLPQQVGDAAERSGLVPVLRQVIERSQRVRLAAAELRDEREHRRRVLGLAREPAQDHPGMFAQRPREAGAREELGRIAIVLRRGPGHDLLEGDGELVRVERPAFTDFLARRGDLVPGLQCDPPTVSACGRTGRPPVVSAAQGSRRPWAQRPPGRSARRRASGRPRHTTATLGRPRSATPRDSSRPMCLA